MDSLISEQQLGMALLRSFEREQPGSFMEFDQVVAPSLQYAQGNRYLSVATSVASPSNPSTLMAAGAETRRRCGHPVGGESSPPAQSLIWTTPN